MAERPATILVVDDNPATHYTTSRVLKSAGFIIHNAVTGMEALSKATLQVDAIVLDVQLPDIDGFEVCRRLRQIDGLNRIPVIHLSATFVKDIDKVHGLEMGADGYLTHPVEPPVLIATVNAFLRMRRAEEERRNSEGKFRAVFERALDGICLLSEDLLYLEVNPAMCQIMERSRQELIGRHVFEFMPSDRISQARQIVSELDARGVWRGACPLLSPANRLIQLEWSMSRHTVPGVRLAIVSDITERYLAEEQRQQLLASERAARTEAERANRLKDEFLATLSHELRTPLNAILGWAQILQSSPPTDADIKEGLEAIQRNAQVQTQLIADLLDVSRIISGKLRLEIQETNPSTVVDAALSAVQPAADAKGVAIQKILDPNAGTVRADLARIQQVVWNLVNNAVKFTPIGGRVLVSVNRIDGLVQISVSDDGAGMKAELIPHVFERFQQGDSTTTRSHGGLGLGLAIVKHLVEMHGGTVSASSEGLGKGSTFTVRLPVAAVHHVDDPATPTVATIHRKPAFSAQTPRLKGVRILVVDDDKDARGLLRRILRECEAEVQEAGGVEEALLTVESFKPDLLVSDIGMPGRDGYDLIRNLRARGHTEQSLPAIALTAFARASDRQRALECGFQVHVTKPVEAAELTSIIASLASGKPTASRAEAGTGA